MPPNDGMKAYVLAAGYATRMYPLTRDCPKALLEVGGEEILTHLMRHLRNLEGLTEVVLVTNARFVGLFEAWVAAQEPWIRFTVLNDGTTSNEDRLGALGDLQLALDRVPPGDDAALVLASDYLFELDLRDVCDQFRKRGRTTLVVRTVEPTAGPSPYSEVILGDEGRVVCLREKPRERETDLSAIALYLFRPDDLAMLGDFLEEGSSDALGHFLSWLVERVPCYSVRLEGAWHDIGSLEGLAEARARWGRDDTSPA